MTHSHSDTRDTTPDSVADSAATGFATKARFATDMRSFYSRCPSNYLRYRLALLRTMADGLAAASATFPSHPQLAKNLNCEIDLCENILNGRKS